MYRVMHNYELAEKCVNSIEGSIKRATANPRCAIPQFFVDKLNTSRKGSLQLLLPINLQSSFGAPDCAVVLDYVEKEGEEPMYHITTLLSLDMAYANARLIQKIDQEWLLDCLPKKKPDQKPPQNQNSGSRTFKPTDNPRIVTPSPSVHNHVTKHTYTTRPCKYEKEKGVCRRQDCTNCTIIGSFGYKRQSHFLDIQ
jgi:hypothetical protein